MNQRSLLLLPVLALVACQSEQPETAQTESAAPATAETTQAAADQPVRVDLINTQRQPVGTATLTQTAEGVQVALALTNLPAGTHGLHFHQNGACEPPAFESAGGHFNPTNKQHGFQNPQGPHAGDLPNITVGANGRADTTVVDNVVTLQPNQPNSLLKQGGTSLMVHASADDYKTDPSGNSGARIACGVVGGGQHPQH